MVTETKLCIHHVSKTEHILYVITLTIIELTYEQHLTQLILHNY